MDALLLAAGFGTRLHPLTQQIPKALLPIYGTPLLDYHLTRLLEAPSSPAGSVVRRVIVNGHHLGDQIRVHIDSHPQRDHIHFSFEPTILGTGGTIAQIAERSPSDPFLVVNADALFPAPIDEAVAFHRKHDYLVTMVLARSPVWPNVQVAGDRVATILRDRCDATAFTFTGLHIISTELLERLPRGVFHDIRDTYEALVAENRLGAFIWSVEGAVPFLEIGTPEAYLEAHRVCVGEGSRSFALPTASDAGVTPTPGFGFIDADTTLGEDTEVEESIVLGNAHLGTGARIRHSIIGPGVKVTGEIRDRLVTTYGTRAIGPFGSEPDGRL